MYPKVRAQKFKLAEPSADEFTECGGTFDGQDFIESKNTSTDNYWATSLGKLCDRHTHVVTIEYEFNDGTKPFESHRDEGPA